MLQNPDDAVIWRGPRKNGLIKQFLKDVDWGEIDYLVVDAPPGWVLMQECAKFSKMGVLEANCVSPMSWTEKRPPHGL